MSWVPTVTTPRCCRPPSCRPTLPLRRPLTTLTSITQCRGSFHMEMDHYDVVPQAAAEKILATAKKPVHDEDEE